MFRNTCLQQNRKRGYGKVTVLFLFLLISTHPFHLSAETEQNLDSIISKRNQQIRKLLDKRLGVQNLIEELKDREWSVIEVLQVLNNNIKNIQEELRGIQRRINTLREKISATAEKINILEDEIQADRKRVHQQLYALYYMKRIRKLTQLVGVSSLKNYVRNQRLIQRSTELEARTLERLKSNLIRLEEELLHRKEQREKLMALKRDQEEQRKLLSFERQQQYTYLHHIRQDRSLRVKYLREIQVELEQLNDMIHSLEQKRQNEERIKDFKGLYRHKHKLRSPVTGKIVYRFEQEQSPYYTLFKRGVLVETKTNAEVHSILSGKVVWSGPFRGYKNLVILDHGKGSFSVYGNLEEVFVIIDDVVETHDVIGTVAYSEMEDRYLFYFETRYNKRAVNPEQWLKQPAWE